MFDVVEIAKTILGVGGGDDTSLLLSDITSSSHQYNGLWQLVRNVYDNVVMPVGLSFLLLYFIFAFLDIVNKDMSSTNVLFSILIKFLLSYVLMRNSFTLVEYFLQFSNVFALSISNVLNGSVGGTGSVESAAVTEFLNGLEDLSFMNKIWAWCGLIIPWILCLVANAASYILSISRIVELCIRTMLCPIAVCDIFQNGLEHSNGMKNLKGIFAVCFQSVIMVTIVIICNYCTLMSVSHIAQTGVIGFESLFFVSFVNLAKLGLLFKSISFSKEILGA